MPAKKKSPQAPSPAPDDGVPPPIALEDALHSGHLYFILKRARCGAKQSRDMLMLLYRECVDNGKEPRPAVHAFMSEALGDIHAGHDANHAFGLKKDRSGRGKRSLAGDVPRIITDEESTARLIEHMPEYRDWLIAHYLHQQGASPRLDKVRRAGAAEKYGVTEEMVRRAWKKYVSPSPDQMAISESFAVVEDSWNQFHTFVKQHRERDDAQTIAAKWRERSVKSLRRLAREAAIASPDVPALVLWSRGVVNDPELVAVLFLCLEQFEVDDHSARITEDEAKAAFITAVNSKRG